MRSGRLGLSIIVDIGKRRFCELLRDLLRPRLLFPSPITTPTLVRMAEAAARETAASEVETVPQAAVLWRVLPPPPIALFEGSTPTAAVRDDAAGMEPAAVLGATHSNPFP